MKVFVTGAGGFIGSSILDHLLNYGHTASGHIRSEAGNITEASLPGGCLSGGLYNIGGLEVLKFRDFILKTASAMSVKLTVLPIPRLFFYLALKLGPLCPRALTESKYKLLGTDHYVSISRAKKAGFSPEWDMKSGLSKTVSWYRESGILP